MQQNHEIWWLFLKFNGQKDFKYGNDKFLAWGTWHGYIWEEPMPKSGQIAFIVP